MAVEPVAGVLLEQVPQPLLVVRLAFDEDGWCGSFRRRTNHLRLVCDKPGVLEFIVGLDDFDELSDHESGSSLVLLSSPRRRRHRQKRGIASC